MDIIVTASLILNHIRYMFFSCQLNHIFCICENKGADELYLNRVADQGFCFCSIDSTIPSVVHTVQHGLC